MIQASFSVSQNHPSLAGHFPGKPIVPGVVILENVLNIFKRTGLKAGSLSKVKFASPLLPEASAAVLIEESASNKFSFKVHSNNKTLIASGFILGDNA